MTAVRTGAIVVGGGIFGVTAALELQARGVRTTLLERGKIPHPLAESTDISKAIRMDYGTDEDYAARVEQALPLWREWNARFGEELFHETGVTFLVRGEMSGYERASFDVLTRRGHALVRLDEKEIRSRWPAFAGFTDGYFNPKGGWAESGRIVARLARELEDVREDTRVLRVEEHRAITDRGIFEGDFVIVAAGAWSPALVPPTTEGAFRNPGQPVFHLRANHVNVPTFAADLARTGWYGFPAHNCVIKIANHGPGIESDLDARTPPDEKPLREFLVRAIPALADAPIVFSRTCIYCDTHDENFWIAQHPELRITLATGGSGHAFKFAPLLGKWIADAAINKQTDAKFNWRAATKKPEKSGTKEEARKR